MAEPTAVSYGNSTFSDTGTTNETVAGVSWQSGDRVLVFGGCSSNNAVGQLATPTVTGLSGTGLTFSLVDAVNNAVGSTDTTVFLWSATASGTGSGTIQSVTSASADLRNGIAVFVFRGTDGIGTPVQVDNSSAKTFNLTRAQANSHVIAMLADFNQANDVAVTATPTGTVRFAEAEAGQADYFVLSWGDQGATGTTAYGIASHTGTVDFSGLLVEVFGSAGGGTESTITPGKATLTIEGRAASMNPFTNVFIREVLINEAGSPVTNRTGMSLLVWYGGSPNGAPDLSYSALTTDAAGTASWSIATGTLVYNQPVFYVATDGGVSLSMYTCARMTPTYQ